MVQAGNREDLHPPLSPGTSRSIPLNGCAAVIIFRTIQRPRLLSVTEAAAELNASDAYVRRLLLEQRLYGIKVGPVWAILPDDLRAFERTRRPPGRPSRKQRAAARTSVDRIVTERKQAGTGRMLRKPRR